MHSKARGGRGAERVGEGGEAASLGRRESEHARTQTQARTGWGQRAQRTQPRQNLSLSLRANNQCNRTYFTLHTNGQKIPNSENCPNI